ncbi:Brp/Blh family beta-carotene 15,15'-dioxygenase [Gangjinia marincola]|uniref:Brp/Blh family beta-carotene 15,15'-dioxygenase n=1 Tax=Gangjinia marincola TaxID=578463 RepID=UPI0031D56122
MASVFVPSALLNYIGLGVVLTIGLLHGANDIMLINRQSEIKNRSFSSLKAIFYYTSIILLFAAVFYFLPTLGLLFFVFISAIHFGEQHLAAVLDLIGNTLRYMLYLIYGFVIFMMIFYFNSESTIKIIEQMTGLRLNEGYFFYGLAVSFLLLFLQTLYIHLKEYRLSWQIIIREVLILVTLAILFNYSSLLFSFAVYFVLWHSIPSMRDQLVYLYGKVSVRSLKKYISQAFVFWLVSVLGLILFSISIQQYEDFFLAVFFSFLAAITLPHVFIVSKIKQQE